MKHEFRLSTIVPVVVLILLFVSLGVLIPYRHAFSHSYEYFANPYFEMAYNDCYEIFIEKDGENKVYTVSMSKAKILDIRREVLTPKPQRGIIKTRYPTTNLLL